ncbi:S-layer homology domain-containing protein [Syntrophomonas zehnderi]|nr:S-layer homology domain-containing protein [Syntrophomonas zehnderi]
MNRRRLTAVVLAITMLSGIFLTGFTFQQGIGNVYYETQSEIYDNASYHEQLAGHSANGIERAYFVNADTQGTDLKPYVFEGEVTGTYTMDTMISSLESQGYKVVAGINGDIYDTASGTPKGLTIHNGKIKTSGYAPEYVISFNESGAASLEKVSLGYTLKGTINVPTVVTTPVSEPVQPTDGIQPTDATQSEESLQSADETQPVDSIEPTEPVVAQQTVYVPTPYNADIGFFNVPHGAAKALHLYNRQYASSTKTAGKTVEVILDAGSPENAELTVGGTITATVAEVRNGNCNTPIGDNQLVLSTAGDSAYAVQLAQLIPGSTVEISVYDWGGNLTNSKEAIGVYYVLYDKGQFKSGGTNLNPRTVIGIKPDGTLMLYVLDGRQPGFSAGLGLTDVARHLVALGCSTVVNMDGGGSSVMAVREGGINSKAVAKNSPSGKSQRKTTNGLLLVYDQRGDSDAKHLHTYPSQPLAMPGADIKLTTYASNGKYEPVPLPNGVEYRVDSNSGSSVDGNGLFTAGNTIGTAVIEAASGDLRTTAKVDIQNNITFTTNVQNITIDPGKTFDINVTAKFGFAPIASKDSLFTWTCDPVVGTIDGNGYFQATNQSGISGNIYVEYNGVKQTIPVQVGAASINFADTATHWARDYIGKLAARGVVTGMGNNFYLPDDSLTRAQFLTMLAKTIHDLDVTQATPAGFADVPATEWYYNYVNWGFEKGIVKGLDETTFAPNEKITREQMATMLDNFTKSTDFVLPETNPGVSFKDSSLISPWAVDSVNKIVSLGIIGGYPEGDFKPQGNATRAEAATVTYKLLMIRG